MEQLELKIVNLSKQLGNFALKNINLTIESGEYFALLGPTGAGKTMLLETIMGFNKPDSGQIFIDDKDITQFPPEKRNIGYVPQNSLLFPHMSVYENIAFGLKMRKVENEKQKQLIENVLQLTNLKSLSQRLPSGLSGGEKQKVALARILVLNPELILLDEPLISVDSEAARELRRELKDLNRDFGKTILHVTHSLVEAISLADRIGLIRLGELQQVGNPKEILAKPINESIASFIGYENIFTAKKIGLQRSFTVLDVSGLTFKVQSSIPNETCKIAINPEKILIEPHATSDLKINQFDASILSLEEFGPIISVYLDMGIRMKATMLKSSFLETDLQIGAKVRVSINPQNVKILFS